MPGAVLGVVTLQQRIAEAELVRAVVMGSAFFPAIDGQPLAHLCLNLCRAFKAGEAIDALDHGLDRKSVV